MAKTRKTARKTGSAKKAAGSKKKSAGATKKTARKTGRATAASPRKPASARELDLRPLKKQLKEHVALLSRSRSADKRVQSALESLRQFQAALNESCDPTMTIPLA